MERNSYQTGWIQEVQRKDWIAFKLSWREKVQGQWIVKSMTLPREVNGKPTVRKDAQQALDKTLAEINGRNGQSMTTPGVTFNGLLDLHWTAYCVRKHIRDSTRDGYNSMLENWIKPFFGEMMMSRISKATVSQFFTHLRENGLSDQYQKNMFGLINKLFELAVAFEIIPVSPVNVMLHRPTVEHGEKQTLPVEKVRDFFEAVPGAWRVPLAVLLLTGIRQGELLGLRWQDIDFDQKLINKRYVVYRGQLVEGLKQTRRTGRAKSHVIGMSDLVVNLLRAHQSSSSFPEMQHFVFCREDGRPLDPDHIRRYVLYPAMETAGIPVVARESGLHMFRHTVVSMVAKRLGLKQAQDQAGHADIGTTSDTYTHVDAEQKLLSADTLQDAFAAHLLPTFDPGKLTN